MPDWKSRLRHLFDRNTPVPRDAEDVVRYLQDTVGPAFRELKDEMESFDHDVRMDVEDEVAHIAFYEEDGTETFRYTVRLRTMRVPNFAFPSINVDGDETRRHQAEALVNGDTEHDDVMGWPENALIRDVLRAYEEHIHWAR